MTAARAAELVAGRTEAAIEALYTQMAALGAEFDTHGALIGNALTLKPTRHRFRVGGRQLYAWCSLDTPFSTRPDRRCRTGRVGLP